MLGDEVRTPPRAGARDTAIPKKSSTAGSPAFPPSTGVPSVHTLLSPRGMAPTGFGIEMRANGRWITLRILGEVDASCVDEVERFLRRRVMRAIDGRGVELDLGGVTFLDWAMLRVLLDMRGQLALRGRAVRIVSQSAAAAALLTATGYDRVLVLVD